MGVCIIVQELVAATPRVNTISASLATTAAKPLPFLGVNFFQPSHFISLGSLPAQNDNPYNATSLDWSLHQVHGCL